MHLSPVKGGFPFKDQHDHTAPIAMSEEDTAESYLKIERGSVICLDDNGEFVLAAAADAGNKPLFLALQRYEDLQAAMAGQYSPASGDADDHPFPYKPGSWARAVKTYNNGPLQGGVRPRITGIHMDDGDVWEDDMFDETVDWESAKPNAALTVADGGLITLATGDAKVIGYLVTGPYKRYCNDAPAVEGMMTGAYRYAIRFQCGL